MARFKKIIIKEKKTEEKWTNEGERMFGIETTSTSYFVHPSGCLLVQFDRRMSIALRST